MNAPNSLYAAAELYDAQYATATHDFRFYARLAKRTGGPILELGAGSGRLTVVLARDGFEVVALDASVAMLGQARRNFRSIPKSVHLVAADFRRYHLRRRFPLILCAFNSLQHCRRAEDFLAVLDCAREHLADGGIFAFDVPNPEARQSSASPALRERFYDERRAQGCEVWETVERADGPLRNLTWEYRWADGMRQSESLTLRDFSPAELAGWLDERGFHVLQHLGDFNENRFNRVSSRQIFACQLA
jgi:SAM-dependent methyltransferase